MTWVADSAQSIPLNPLPPAAMPDAAPAAAYADYKVIRRNGAVVGFEPAKISIAMTKAFLAVNGGQGAASARVRELVAQLTQAVIGALLRGKPGGATFHIEDIQDHVELALMRSGEHEVARAYVLYREQRAQERAAKLRERAEAGRPALHVIDGGVRKPLELPALRSLVEAACTGLGEFVSADLVLGETVKNLYDGVPMEEVYKSAILSARALLEKDPAYSQVTARLLLHTMRREVLGEEVAQADMAARYREYFPSFVRRGVEAGLLDPALLQFDLPRLAGALAAGRDLQFGYLGLQTLYDRYFLHIGDVRIELPQAFFMRVAMGLALNEIDREARAIEFYELLSTFDFMSSTPTLFNSGTQRSQLSSCYLTTVSDDLDGIYEAIKENALLAKYAGGLGNDWTPVRALGAHIRGTNGKSQGVVPFLKVVNDTAVAVNQCFAPDTGVHTQAGVRAIRDVAPGDLVLGIDGEYREVTERMVYNQTDPMVEIRIKHSIEPLRVTAGHPVWAIRGVPMEQSVARTMAWIERGKVGPAWVDAGMLERGDYVAQVVPQEVVPVEGFDEDDAHMYGILLGDGHLSKGGRQFGLSGHPTRDAHLAFVRGYLERRGIHYWETRRGTSYCQVHWSAGLGAQRDATTGRIAGTIGPSMPFARDDLYAADGSKAIAARFAHLPLAQALRLVQGLIETDGNVSRGKEITFTNTSRALIEGLRYQLLRLGVPTAGALRERAGGHEGTRSDGSRVRFDGLTRAWDLRIPALPEIAALVGAKPLVKRNWLRVGKHLFSRVRSVRPIEPVPFVCDLKVEGVRSYMTTGALAHNGGKRKGAVCAYLETWHLDIEEFLELRKNTGDDRRRTHDMNTANWVPDLFMKRVAENAEWTLFSPSDCPDLHDLYGKAFEAAYLRHEARAASGELKLFRKVSAVQLWRRMLSMLFETGHPWITFKDPCNLRSPQQHAGVVHGSNLCTEITLNTSASEIAVCNLGSVNLVAHMREEDGRWTLDHEKLRCTVRTAMRMLDNVVDINYYAVGKARNANLRHRPVGLGIMGFQDCLHLMRVPFAGAEAVEFADRSMEAVCYQAYWASTELAEERGRYSSFQGSLWDRGILPHDTLDLLAAERGGHVEVDRTERLDWNALRERIRAHGMRNSNCVAIAPTATISNIIGVSACIEPTYRNLYVKSNLSGEFTVVNDYLVRDLKKLGLWDEVMIADLKFFDGSLAKIDRIPPELRAIYATAFEVDPTWLVECAARRQKWIDQAQSLNIYMAGASGRKLHETYMLAWLRGLKTTYYLRSLGATSAEKSTTEKIGQLNAVSAGGASHAGFSYSAQGAASGAPHDVREADAPSFCGLDDPQCEACQ
ncbi:MAG: ribonucleoside-diphosphate reductase subunit alpha [Burkholderiales bacterium 70-64]|nr:MAG: ribonucleoside-diphosphate reductase subunit alpha [Burkholderiales bacterium 70-64]